MKSDTRSWDFRLVWFVPLFSGAGPEGVKCMLVVWFLLSPLGSGSWRIRLLSQFAKIMGEEGERGKKEEEGELHKGSPSTLIVAIKSELMLLVPPTASL